MPLLLAGGKRIHYTDWKPANEARETFVLIHGLGSSQNYYAAVVPALTSHNIRCVGLDTTGQGRSPYTNIEQSIYSLAADIVGAMDALSIDKAVIIGHSMAGLTVPTLAATWPDRVTAVVLLGPVYPNPATVPAFRERIEKVERDGMQPMADTIPYAAVGSEATSLHHAFIRELLLASQPAGYVSLCRVIIGVSQEPTNRPIYSKVKCPLYIVAGEEDKTAPSADCQKILDEVSSEEKRIVMLPRTGHWMCVEKPETVAEEVLKIFKAMP